MLGNFGQDFLSFITETFQAVNPQIDKQKYSPPGQLIDVGGYRLHLYSIGQGSPTIIFDQSLGSPGWASYLVFTELAKTNRVVVFDRAGYGWSESSPNPRTSQYVVQELESLLTQAEIEPPYIFVGNSLGGYTARLYAHQYPEKVAGMVLAHCLHEEVVLDFSVNVRLLLAASLVTFKAAEILATLGMGEIAGSLKVFESLKAELSKFPPKALEQLKYSYYNAKQWQAIFDELLALQESSEQLRSANSLGDIPLVVISVGTFLKPFPFSNFLPHQEVDETWSKMQAKLLKISSQSQEIVAADSSHFVWIDEPQVVVKAVQEVVEKVRNKAEEKSSKV